MPTCEHDFGWWRTSSGHQIRFTWSEDTNVLYMYDPRRGEMALACFASAEDVRKMIEDLDPFHADSYLFILKRIQVKK